MKKNYQTSKGRAGTGRVTPRKSRRAPANGASETAFELPDAVNIAVGELAGELEEGLLALAVGAGLQVLGALMETEVTGIAGAKGRWNPDRVAVRHGGDAAEVTLGGRRVPIRRPRVRTVDRSEEIPLKSNTT